MKIADLTSRVLISGYVEENKFLCNAAVGYLRRNDEQYRSMGNKFQVSVSDLEKRFLETLIGHK